MPSALRRFFATLLVHCEVGNPRLLWDKFSSLLSEDFQRSYCSNEKLAHYKTLTDIAQLIESMGKHQADFDLPTVSYKDIQLCKNKKEIEEELNIPVSPEDIIATLNIEFVNKFRSLPCINTQPVDTKTEAERMDEDDGYYLWLTPMPI
ncbi:hypothetical protein RJ639_025217 [Escallonia herrerae]|uniref:Uncharacterized protein n=1 Tax=Escallonia herrerae TaxID=1293975 RepID=A0AA88RTY6_9ASTE|nr:hypothetical protein RJ639_025217 [Escallonia herrerae]